MTVSQIYFDGKNDAVLCDCGHEFRRLYTLELAFDLRVVDMYAYMQNLDVPEVEQTGFGVAVSVSAAPISLRRRVLRASFDCSECGVMTYEIGFDGNRIIALEPVRG